MNCKKLNVGNPRQGICLPRQGIQVQYLVWEDPHAMEQQSPCVTSTDPACHNY